ncbi:alpha-hydroxy-acid oxidizing protein [Azospirillum sp. RWY-5-1]|uniref:Alpha-hydroxy-acid oxidizing protein n=1 Tax=Azospirillum oleiclasticum TaxID=2735135 RepID=A0ABX2TFZ4_9PROT|nr:alpha-hydroxy acid oxidase [Azospirillum oleiclasticum]NYZ15832.1 alpha-hydroxy-acid oxidizing protein [Azospirillum oleiclasticum]NYZ22102.1 alpha-hydroxy-acid oxidizing protein [Azospirillum oleiclasticum]
MTAPIGRCRNVEDVRALAKRRLPRAVFDFIDGGADDEAAMRGNRNQFDAFALVPRVAVGVGGRDQSRTLFGRRFASPFGIGPTGLAGLAWPEAEVALMRGAEAADVPFTLSTVSSVAIEEIGDAAGRPHWFQLYILRDRAISRRLAERAAAAGFETLVVTLDCPVGGNRERDLANRFSLPYRPALAGILDTARRVSWLAQIARHGAPQPRNMAEAAARSGSTSLLAFMEAQLDPSVTWDDVREVRRLWRGPLVVKGLLSPADVDRALAVGADGVLVSSHGGRQLGAAVPPLFMLPRILDAASGRLTVLCDSGFRRGTDIMKALALGADGVLMGRPTLYGVAAAGEAGSRHVLDLLRREVDRAMALLGCTDLAALGPEHVIANAPAPIPASTETRSVPAHPFAAAGT